MAACVCVLCVFVCVCQLVWPFVMLLCAPQSLSALGNCVSALTDPTRKHVPYRDSKLTRILQDSLGGNCYTTILATLSPIAANAEDSVSTLQFADRARHVHTKVKVNEVVDDGILLARALKTIAQLKRHLAEQTNEKYAPLYVG